LEQERNVDLAVAQASLGQLVKDIDAKALSKRSFPLLISFHLLPVYTHTGFF
jgi:hypothetical protein